MGIFSYFSKVKTLKRKARGFYSTYKAEQAKYDCGSAISEVINPRLATAKLKFNETMDKLAEIDPTCPKKRL